MFFQCQVSSGCIPKLFLNWLIFHKVFLNMRFDILDTLYALEFDWRFTPSRQSLVQM